MITRSEAARRLDVSKQRLDQIVDQVPRPLFFIKDKKTNKWGVDDTHPAWLSLVRQYEEKSKQKDRRKKEEKGLIKVPPAKVPHDFKKRAREAVDNLAGIELELKAHEGELRKKAASGGIAEERLAQEQLRTLEIKREVAPVGLMRHWDSFAENLIQRLYRRPHEISPEVKALYLSNEDKKAENKIVRELESIVIDVWKEVIQDMEKEKIKLEEMLKAYNAAKHRSQSITN